MLDNATIDALARAYHVAEKQRRRTRAPSVLHPGFTTEDAYAVQRAWAHAGDTFLVDYGPLGTITTRFV